MRLELTNIGFAIRCLSRLATRAINWNGRRDSNSRVEFGRLACFQLHHFRGCAGRAARAWFWGENFWSSWQDLDPQPRRSKRRALPFELQERKRLVGEDRVELSPRVPRTRMLALHHTPLTELVRQVRLELTIPCLRDRCLGPV